MSVLLTLTRIVQSAAEADSPAVQVNCVVDGIQREMAVDVCSLFLRTDHGELLLVASHGLGQAAIGRVSVPAGKGLVGEVAESRHPLNIVEPARHPVFFYLPGSDEEQFRSFCAVPLVRRGAVIGVLVVQRRAPAAFSPEEEAFLVTLGAQLALVVANWEDWQLAEASGFRNLTGLPGAPGIGMGQVYLCEDLDLFSVADGRCVNMQEELHMWRQLLATVQTEVKAEQSTLDSSLSQEVSGIFDAYLMLLADPMLTQGVEEGIGGGRDLPSALRIVVQHYADLFMAMDDPYLRARHEDIRHLGNRLYSAWIRSQHTSASALPQGPVILVGRHVSVSDIANTPREQLAGVVCFQGSILSHTAVLANALGVPAVMGVGEVKGLADGVSILIDGAAGKVFLEPDSVLQQEYSKLQASEHAFTDRLESLRDKPAVTRDGVAISLYANSGLTADIMPGLRNGAEGLGLYRTEIPFMISETFPSEEEQYQLYREVMAAYGDKPVYMRVLDIGADKPLPYFPIHEENPALGWRGIRFCLDNASLLLSQLRAMLRAAGMAGNLQIILPMVSALGELREFTAVLDDALNQLDSAGHAVRRPPVGIMVEVPAAISQLGKWRSYIDFISIGSNDLSQYVLAVDRNNPRVAASYDHLHPAVVAEIARVVQAAEQLDLPVSLCGEMSSDPHAVPLLVAMGIRRLSMSAAQLPRIKWLIRAMDSAKAQSVYDEVCKAGDSDEIRAVTSAYLSDLAFPGLVKQTR